ncbi:hypothetical protein BH23THE1_BH23THE1_35850 [soil metagenome]
MKVDIHRQWVTRFYFTALGVSTMRDMIALFIVVNSYSLKDIFGLTLILSFTLHVILVEFWIRFLVVS